MAYNNQPTATPDISSLNIQVDTSIMAQVCNTVNSLAAESANAEQYVSYPGTLDDDIGFYSYEYSNSKLAQLSEKINEYVDKLNQLKGWVGEATQAAINGDLTKAGDGSLDNFNPSGGGGGGGDDSGFDPEGETTPAEDVVEEDDKKDDDKGIESNNVTDDTTPVEEQNNSEPSSEVPSTNPNPNGDDSGDDDNGDDDDPNKKKDDDSGDDNGDDDDPSKNKDNDNDSDADVEVVSTEARLTPTSDDDIHMDDSEADILPTRPPGRDDDSDGGRDSDKDKDGTGGGGGGGGGGFGSKTAGSQANNNSKNANGKNGTSGTAGQKSTSSTSRTGAGAINTRTGGLNGSGVRTGSTRYLSPLSVAGIGLAAGGLLAGAGILARNQFYTYTFTPDDWHSLDGETQNAAVEDFKRIGFDDEEFNYFTSATFKIKATELDEFIKKVKKAKDIDTQLDAELMQMYGFTCINNDDDVDKYRLFLMLIIDGRDPLDETNIFNILNTSLDEDDVDFIYSGLNYEEYIYDTYSQDLEEYEEVEV